MPGATRSLTSDGVQKPAVAAGTFTRFMRAVAIVQRYQDENWRRLRVNDICTEIKRLLKEEAAR